MPIYEYECRGCGKRFEKLVFSSENPSINCPECGSTDTQRLMSIFACGGKDPFPNVSTKDMGSTSTCASSSFS